MKRLVICCDGTWNRPDSPNITNIEKLARSVQTDPGSTGGVQQLVHYLSGVGAAGYEGDRLLGALGFGLFSNMLGGYRFLAQNYEPGDEVFVFGFSRGAFTARTLVGMIDYVGLITKLALVQEQLATARDFYRTRTGDEPPAELADWRAEHCHPQTPIAFVGVFETVGALGVPVASFLGPRFHNLRLSDQVVCARHALAIDEVRPTFKPSLWRARDDGATEDARVKQVWFAGAHSDVGGGYDDTGHSDSALLWMATEAHEQGLVFDVPLLGMYVASGSPAVRHSPLEPLLRKETVLKPEKLLLGITTADARLRGALQGHKGLRPLGRPGQLSVRVASTALEDLAGGEYAPANLAALAEPVAEPVTRLPHADPATTLALLEPLGKPTWRTGERHAL